MADRHGQALWPGVQSVVSCIYRCSHGITPGIAHLTILPQDNLPAEFGDLVITDDFESIPIPDCKINDIKFVQGANGIEWVLEIIDRRWKWRNLGLINGWYNQLNPFGYLLPFTIRSPRELATLCLAALGETVYDISALPPGINYPGPYSENLLRNTSSVNPPIDWYSIPPAQALTQVAEMFGCRIVYQVLQNRILLAKQGLGNLLPPGSIAKQGPSLKAPETPDSVGVVGAPSRFQLRLKLDAVGEEWSGDHRPLNDLSYAPKLIAPAKQVELIEIYNGVAADYIFAVYINPVYGEPATGPSRRLFGASSTGTLSGVAIAIDLQDQINADPVISDFLIASSAGAGGDPTAFLTLTARRPSAQFSVFVKLVPATGDGARLVPMGIKTSTVVVGTEGNKEDRWAFLQPPTFGGSPLSSVQATGRLTFEQARALAQKTVYKTYRISDSDVSDDGVPIQVPFYGPIRNRLQIVLSDTQVEQIVPEVADATLRDTNGRRVIENFYNGFSRDKPAVVYGSIARNIDSKAGGVIHADAIQVVGGVARNIVGREPNTPANQRIFVKFTIDVAKQLVIFDSPVYYYVPSNGSRFVAPELVLQCAVMIRDNHHNQLVNYTKIRPLPGQNTKTNPKIKRCDDVQFNFIGVYSNSDEIIRTESLEADADVRSDYYLDGLQAQYFFSEGQTLEYNGIKSLELDGAIQQITWSIGAAAVTIASRNTEHEVWQPPYRANLRAQFVDEIVNDATRPQRAQPWNNAEEFMR